MESWQLAIESAWSLTLQGWYNVSIRNKSTSVHFYCRYWVCLLINFDPLESFYLTFLFAYTCNYNFNNKTLFSRNRQEFTHFISIPLNAKTLQDAFLEFKMVSLPIVNILNIIKVMILWAVFRSRFCHFKKTLFFWVLLILYRSVSGRINRPFQS